MFLLEKVSVEVNKEGNFEVFKEKPNKEKQESDEESDTTDMPKLESEECAAKRINQSGKGVKICLVCLDQMLSRLTISLAQLKAGNN